jgi:3-methyladenine DNA glycosylase AlkD
MTAAQILAELEAMGTESCKRIFLNHGAKEPLFGVKVQDLKKIQKQVKKNHELALELYNTGNSDAQYLAGLIADEKKMTQKDLQSWADSASWYMLSEYTVPWIAAESAHGFALALEWIDSSKEHLQATGWATLSSLASIKPDQELDLNAYKTLLHRVGKEIPDAPNRVRYVMNGFVIATGCFIKQLTAEALKVGKAIGTIHVDMGGTACKVPSAPEYIQKAIDKDSLGKKKKMARC